MSTRRNEVCEEKKKENRRECGIEPGEERAGLQSLILRHFQSSELRKLAERVIIDDGTNQRRVQTKSVNNQSRVGSGLLKGRKTERNVSAKKKTQPAVRTRPTGVATKNVAKGRNSASNFGFSSSSFTVRNKSTPGPTTPSKYASSQSVANLKSNSFEKRGSQRTTSSSKTRSTQSKVLTKSSKPHPERKKRQVSINDSTIEQTIANLVNVEREEENEMSWGELDFEIDPVRLEHNKRIFISQRDDDDRDEFESEEDGEWGEISLPSKIDNTSIHEMEESTDTNNSSPPLLSRKAAATAEADNLNPSSHSGPTLLQFRDSSFKNHTVGQMSFNPDVQRWENTCSDDEQKIMQAFETSSWSSDSESCPENSSCNTKTNHSVAEPSYFRISESDLHDLNQSELLSSRLLVQESPSSSTSVFDSLATRHSEESSLPISHSKLTELTIQRIVHQARQHNF